jgi:hypothetical protein
METPDDRGQEGPFGWVSRPRGGGESKNSFTQRNALSRATSMESKS